jgi:phosphoribosylformylglycinamidine cyclo-ligase
MRIVKDGLFEPPVIFRLIQQASGAPDREMYQVFNMGTRLEIYTDDTAADSLIAVAQQFGVDARVIGHVEASDRASVTIRTANGELVYPV